MGCARTNCPHTTFGLLYLVAAVHGVLATDVQLAHAVHGHMIWEDIQGDDDERRQRTWTGLPADRGSGGRRYGQQTDGAGTTGLKELMQLLLNDRQRLEKDLVEEQCIRDRAMEERVLQELRGIVAKGVTGQLRATERGQWKRYVPEAKGSTIKGMQRDGLHICHRVTKL